MFGSDADFPFQFGSIRSEVHDCPALVHIDTNSHIWVCIPEQLLVRTIKDVPPKSTFRLGVGLLLAVIVSKFRHGHVDQFALFFQLAIIFTAIGIRFQKQLIRSFPSSHLIHPARSDEHHVIRITVVILFLRTILIDQIIQIWIFPCLGIINHTAQHVLRMCTEIGSVSVIACQKVSGKMRDRNDSAVLRLIGSRCMCVLFGRNPRCPRTAVKQCVPGIVTGMVCFRAFFPTGSNRTFYRRICFLNVICKIRVHII